MLELGCTWFFIHFCKVLHIYKFNHLRSNVLFHYWLLDLGYCEDIKPMTCAVHEPVVLFLLWSNLWAISWRKHSINSSSDSVSVNSLVVIIAYFTKSNIAEYDNERPNARRTSTKTCDLMNEQTDSKKRWWLVSFFLVPLHDLVSNGDLS